MFLEPHIGLPIGCIEIICGSMFSGKTEELLRRIKRAQIANLKVEIFKPTIDNRYHDTDVISHDYNKIEASTIAHSSNILLLVSPDTDVVAIDEAQFLDDELGSVADKLANKGLRVIIAGLDMDFKGQPFGPIPGILARAEYITKLHAICVNCGGLANYSYRKSANMSTVLLGEKDLYEPRCRKCYHI
jgi:thymidine kinase